MPTPVKSKPTAHQPEAKTTNTGISVWTLILLFTNILLLAIIVTLFWRQANSNPESIQTYSQPETQLNPTPNSSNLGKRHQLSYQKWLEILKQEADVIAAKNPPNLAIIAGDSLSLWFPNDLLPHTNTWLNQGISGETSTGLFKRLHFFAKTQPQTIWVMIGINDLIRGKSDREIIQNYQKIITNLRRTHPQTEIIVQSILPHAGKAATWEGRDKLLKIPNTRIQQLNTQIQAFATKNNAIFLNLYPLFSDSQGNLLPELSTDGLHLNRQGYLVWRSAMLFRRP